MTDGDKTIVSLGVIALTVPIILVAHGRGVFTNDAAGVMIAIVLIALAIFAIAVFPKTR